MRKLMLTTSLAVTTAFFAGCDPKPENKPPSTPAPVTAASPVASPVGSPVPSATTTPAKPGASPEIKKVDNTNMKKDQAPAATPTPKKV